MKEAAEAILGVILLAAMWWAWSRFVRANLKAKPDPLPDDVADAIDQLIMSMAWEEDYTDEYKRRVMVDALIYSRDRLE